MNPDKKDQNVGSLVDYYNRMSFTKVFGELLDLRGLYFYVKMLNLI